MRKVEKCWGRVYYRRGRTKRFDCRINLILIQRNVLKIVINKEKYINQIRAGIWQDTNSFLTDALKERITNAWHCTGWIQYFHKKSHYLGYHK